MIKLSLESGEFMIANSQTFFEKNRGAFIEFISQTSVELLKSDKEYRKLVKENNELLNKYPKLREIIDDNEVNGINQEECKALSRIIDNKLQLKMREYEEIFFKGYKEACFYFKKMGIFDEEK